jgi:hypothetical protein
MDNDNDLVVRDYATVEDLDDVFKKFFWRKDLKTI